VIQPGTVLGPLRPQVVRQTGLAPISVVAPATHDTGSAVAAVPARGESWAFISSGTWSLMGTETREPITSEKALAYNFTNEGGVGGTVRLLKNIMGMWLLQECRRTWEAGGVELDYEKLMQLAAEAPAFASVIDPDDESFILPPRMPDAIADYCRRTGQTVPATPGSIVRTALEALALRYRWVLERLEELTGRRMDAIHVVGGGSRNTLLCQWTADSCGRPVIAGPIEATAIGNVLVQMIGLGLVGNLEQAREIVRESFEVRTYEPADPGRWDEPYRRFAGLLK
jgi:rhamnulokinase